MREPYDLSSLRNLCGLRSAPPLSAESRQRLLDQLRARIAACDWFTIGVMAPAPAAAVDALRACEQTLGWPTLECEAEQAPACGEPSGAVFLKGNQATGRFRMRPETGLGEGVLITGHCPAHPELEGTWGPFPLDFFEGTAGP